MKKASLRWLFLIIDKRSIAVATGISIATAITAAAWGASFHRASNIDGQVTTAHVLAIHGLDRCLGFRSA